MTLKKYFKTHNRGHNKPPLLSVSRSGDLSHNRAAFGDVCAKDSPLEYFSKSLQQKERHSASVPWVTPGEVPCTRAFKPVPIQRKSDFWTVSGNTAIFLPTPGGAQGCKHQQHRNVDQKMPRFIGADEKA